MGLLSKREKLLLQILAILSMGYISAAQLFPIGVKIIDNQRVIYRETDKLQKLERLKVGSNQIINNIAGLQGKYEKLEQRLPAQPQCPELLKQLEQGAEASGIKLMAINTVIGASGEVVLNPTISGTPQNMAGFIKLIENLPRLVTVDSVEMTFQGQEPIGKLNIKAYYSNVEVNPT